MAKTRVFIDTNIIIEAFRTGCWTAICNKFAIETVDKCVEEALTGNPDDPGRVHIDRDALLEGLADRHQVGKLELAKLVLTHPSCHGLDDGELHLLAWLHAQGLLPTPLSSFPRPTRRLSWPQVISDGSTHLRPWSIWPTNPA